MKKSSKILVALTGLAVLCVCAAMAAPMGMGDGDGRGMMKDGAGLQTIITKMQENGVDTTELETAIADGNQDAVRAFLQENRPADAPERQQNGERMQQMITKMQENGVDTTELKAAIADGDREAVHAFLQENRPADAPEHSQDGEHSHPAGANGFRNGGQQSDA